MERFDLAGSFTGRGMLALTPDVAQKIKQLDLIDDVEVIFADTTTVEPDIFPDSRYYRWNRDNFGPLEIPFRGMTIQIDEYTLAKYGSTIQNYEDVGEVEIDVDQLTINGQEVAEV